MISEAQRPKGRLLAVGDIHGCFDHLRQLMALVRPTPSDQVVFLGDYVDRGPAARDVLDFLIDFGRRYPKSVFLKGNHEAMFLDFLTGRERLPFLINGGQTTLKSYEQKNAVAIPEEHRAFLAALRLSFDTEHFIFVHAGLRPGLPLEEQQEEDLLWIRRDFLDADDYDWGKTIVFGHTPLQEPFLSPGRIGIDTGAVYGRYLSCCDVETLRFWRYPEEKDVRGKE
ncbi:MAG TPA: metallophosphoesterase family protein [Desulfuromonadales bacterium]|nr:metallophosphoesterase family protein [Desulfuromonadales bacterium]